MCLQLPFWTIFHVLKQCLHTTLSPPLGTTLYTKDRFCFQLMQSETPSFFFSFLSVIYTHTMNFEPMTLTSTSTSTSTHFVEGEEPFEPGDFHLLTISSFLSLSDNYFSISSQMLWFQSTYFYTINSIVIMSNILKSQAQHVSIYGIDMNY